MTTTYYSEREALETGAFYAGYQTPEEIRAVLEKAEVSETQVANPLVTMLGDDEESARLKKSLTKKVQVRTIPTKDGKNKVSLAVGQFRDGFDLWLIDPKTGMGMRT